MASAIPRRGWRGRWVVLFGWLAPVALGAQAPAGAGGLPAVAPERLGARRDSLVARAATGIVGWWRMTRAPEAAGGWRYVESLVVDDVADLTTLLVTDSALAIRRLRQTGEAWDQPVAVSIDRHGDQVTGQATRSGGRGIVLQAVEAAAPGVPDLNAVPLLVVGTPWSAGASGQWRVHDAAAGRDVVLAVQVESLEAARGGLPDVWRVAVRRDGIATRYRVAAQAPWRLLGIATDGAPFALVAP